MRIYSRTKESKDDIDGEDSVSSDRGRTRLLIYDDFPGDSIHMFRFVSVPNTL